jgi:hypothetical protein
MSAPKGRESWTPQPLPLQTGIFEGAAKRAIMRFVDPESAVADWGAKAMPPLWQYFSR